MSLPNSLALLVTGWTSEDKLARIFCSILAAVPLLILAMVVLTRHENQDNNKGETRDNPFIPPPPATGAV